MTPGMGPGGEYLALVLLVDDQVMIGEAIRRALAQQTNLNFHYCADPHRAIAMAKELRPTVILQDLVMPGVNGLDLVRRYREDPETAGIPVIVLSTKEDPAVKSEAFAVGANDYLVKLPDRLELLARIRYHSRAYLNQLQRDAAYRALRESQRALMEANLELQRLTKVDGLTRLSNRRYFDEFLAAEWRRAQASETPISLLMMDVDDFKRYNDSYGHLAGDEVLKQVAEAVMGQSGRPVDLAARFGGEEFVMVLSGISAVATLAVGEKLRQAILALQLPHQASRTGLGQVSVSIGGAVMIPQQGSLPSMLLDAADKALYEAKDRGRNCVVMRSL